MPAPSAPELPIYAKQWKRCETRVIVALDPPKFTQEQQDTFASGPLSNYAWSFQWLTAGPLIADNAVKLRSYGVPLFEWFATRESYGWFPMSRNQPFALEAIINFPLADPVYSVPIFLPGLENNAGDEDDPLLIYQQGSATSRSLQVGDSGKDGHIRIIANGSDVSDIANDMADHTLRIEWDPLLQVNPKKYTVLWDSVNIFETDTASAPNTKFQCGWVHNIVTDKDTGAVVQAPGTMGTPVVVFLLKNFKTTQLGSLGYETYDDPPWATPNVTGTNHEDSAVGEIHTQDNHRWAIMPPKLYGLINGDRGRNVQMSMAQMVLNVGFGDPNEMLQFPWAGRPVIIDVRQVDAEGNPTDWRRKMVGRIRRLQPRLSDSNRTYSLSIAGLVESKLNVIAPRTWRGTNEDNAIINTNYTIADIWNDILDVGEALYGADPTISDRLIRANTLIAGDNGTGGQRLIEVYSRLVDENAYEYYVDYATSGSARHGRMRTHAWTIGTGTADYSIPASQILSVDIDEDADQGPGQVSYRQNLPEAQEDQLVSTWLMPTPGTFPTVPIPINQPILSDSIAFAKELQATSLFTLKDKDNNNVTGGIAQHRFKLQSAQRRRIDINIRGRDHIDPSDELAFVDPINYPDETWIVDKESWTVKDAVFESRVTLCTTQWVEAIKRSM